MLEAAVSALSQMFTPRFRAVLWKSVALAVGILIALGIALQRLLVWMVDSGGAWVETSVGTAYHGVLTIVELGLAVLAGFGIVIGLVFLMPAVTALVASFFADEIAETVERTYYPADPPGRALPVGRAILQGLETALLAVLVYLCALPFLLIAGLGVLVFFFATAFLLGREYFELAAMRFHPVAEAKAMRKRHQGTVFVAGMLIAGFVSVPILNLATPLFATALMVHMHKRLIESRRLATPARQAP